MLEGTNSENIENLFYVDPDVYDIPNLNDYESPQIDSYSTLEHVNTSNQIDLIIENYETVNNNRTPIYSDLNLNNNSVDKQLVPVKLSKPRVCFYWCWSIFFAVICTLVILTAIVIIILVTSSIKFLFLIHQLEF